MSLKWGEKRKYPKPVPFVVPEGTVDGGQTDRVISPRLVHPMVQKYHTCLWCSEMEGIVGEEPVVMFSTKHPDFSGLRILYCSIHDWVEAGNSDPYMLNR